MRVETVIDFLAANIDCVQLPSLSGDEVSNELELCTGQWYNEHSASFFYTNMINEYIQEENPLQQELRQPKKVIRPGKPMRRHRHRDISVKPVSKDQLKLFRLELRAHRIRLGLTQAEAAKSIGKVTNRRTSQTSLCRFENNQLHFNNMNNLYPYFKQWLLETQSS